MSSGFVQWVMSLLGLAAGGGAAAKTVLNASAVEARLTTLERSDAHQSAQISDGIAAVARIEGKLDEVSQTMRDVRIHLMGHE